MNIAVLMGAGASFGAGSVDPEPPPLGGQLYEELKRAYPDSWGSQFTAEENALFREDFEQGMSMLWGNQGNRAQRLIIDMALYFTRFRITGPNRYSDLLRALFSKGNDHRVVFCTLNYDCLLEQALMGGGAAVRSLWRVLGAGQGPIDVLKPHGSCNYLDPLTRNMKGVTMDGVGIAYTHSEVPSPSDLEIVAPEEVEAIYEAAEGLSIPPAISLYEPTKHSPVGGGLIQKVREHWADVVPNADVVLSIGARPVAQDAHIWDPILNSNAQVLFVGGQDRDYGRRAWELGERMEYFGLTFEESIPRIEERLDKPPPEKALWVPGQT
jgi:hypothetical protein